jgi:hypothetical protein
MTVARITMILARTKQKPKHKSNWIIDFPSPDPAGDKVVISNHPN